MRSVSAYGSTHGGASGSRLALAVEVLHLLRGVARSGDLGRGNRLLDLGQLGRRQRDRESAERLLELRPGPRADQRDDRVALGEDPGERELRRAHTACCGNLSERRDQALVALAVLAAEPRQVSATVAR